LRTSLKGLSKTLIAGTAAGALAVSGLAVAFAPPAGANSTTTTNRLGGTNRYDTARIAAEATFTSGSANVVLASGENFPDGLASASLAGSLGAPLLLTPTASLAAETASALSTMHVHTIYIAGGTAAVSAAVETQLTGLGYTVNRVAGANRYDTAAKVAAASAGFRAIGTIGGVKTAYLATGTNFPDALSAGSGSYVKNLPILLTNPTTLSAETSAAITALGIKNVIILGGPVAVSTGVETAVKALGATTSRLNGPTRFDTAAAVATNDSNPVISGGLGMSLANIALPSGLNFPDALVAAEIQSPTVLCADPAPSATTAFLSTNAAAIGNITALGGTAAVSAACLTAAQTAATPSAGTVTFAAVAGGTSFTATFAKAVNTPINTNFKLNNGVAGVSIGAVDPTTNPLVFLVQIVGPAGFLHPGDVIATSATPPTDTSGNPVSPASFTVPANVPPAVTSTIFKIGGHAVNITFSKPVNIAPANTTLTGAGGPLVTGIGTSLDGTSFTITTTSAITNASVLTVTTALTDFLGAHLPATFTTTAGPTGVAPTISAVKVVPSTATGFPAAVQGSVSDGTMTFTAKPGSAADGAFGELFQVSTTYSAAATSVTAVPSTVSGVTTFAVTIPQSFTAVQAQGALNALAPFNTVLVASGTGTTPIGAVGGIAATPLAGGVTNQAVVAVLSEPVVPSAGSPYGTLHFATTMAVAVLLPPGGEVDNLAAPSIVAGLNHAIHAGQVITTGTSVSYTQPAPVVMDFGGNTLPVQTLTSS
jgi:putative cell wall-binding protein